MARGWAGSCWTASSPWRGSTVIARVTAPNEASLGLHERHGFARVGHERQVAFKHGVWLDVVTLQRVLMD